MFLLAEEFNHSFGLDSIPSSPCHCQSCCSPGHSVYLISNCISIPTRAPSSQVGQSHAGLSRYHQDLWVISMLGHVLWLLWLQSRGSASRTWPPCLFPFPSENCLGAVLPLFEKVPHLSLPGCSFSDSLSPLHFHCLCCFQCHV